LICKQANIRRQGSSYKTKWHESNTVQLTSWQHLVTLQRDTTVYVCKTWDDEATCHVLCAVAALFKAQTFKLQLLYWLFCENFSWIGAIRTSASTRHGAKNDGVGYARQMISQLRRCRLDKRQSDAHWYYTTHVHSTCTFAPGHNSVINIPAVEFVGPVSKCCPPMSCSPLPPPSLARYAIAIDQTFQLVRIKIDHRRRSQIST